MYKMTKWIPIYRGVIPAFVHYANTIWHFHISSNKLALKQYYFSEVFDYTLGSIEYYEGVWGRGGVVTDIKK